MPKLIIRGSSGQVSEIAVRESPLQIGRSSDSGVVLDHPFVSRTHARLECIDGHWQICDAGSRNGVRVNGSPITGPRRLAFGDRVGIVDVVLEFVADADDDATPVWDGRPGLTPENATVWLDPSSWDVYVRGKRIDTRLSVQEFNLMQLLIARYGGICTMDEIGRELWGEGNYDRNLIHRLVHRLKEKVEPFPRAPQFIESIPRVGYRIRPDDGEPGPENSEDGSEH